MPGGKSTEADRAANESGLREKQRAERAIVQACQPAAEWSARSPGQYGVSENKRPSVNSQRHLTHMEQAMVLDPKRACLVERGACQALIQQIQCEAAARLQARGQRSAVTQPASDVGCVTRSLGAPSEAIPEAHDDLEKITAVAAIFRRRQCADLL